MSNKLGVTVNGIQKVGEKAFLTVSGVHKEVKMAFLTVGGVHKKCYEGDSFDPTVVLQDFTYTDNGDGTYTLTGWKGTYNGVKSTELIVPDDPRIIV